MRSRTGRIAGVLCLTLAVGSGALAQSRTFKPEDHYRLRSAADVRLSPDGSTVAFVERFIDAQHRSRSYIWLLTLADGKLKRLSEEDANDSAPHWSPDGRSIAFLTGKIGAANPAATGFLPTAFGSDLAVARLDTGKTDVVAQCTRSPIIRWRIRAQPSRSHGLPMASRSRICRPTTAPKERRVIRR